MPRIESLSEILLEVSDTFLELVNPCVDFLLEVNAFIFFLLLFEIFFFAEALQDGGSEIIRVVQHVLDECHTEVLVGLINFILTLELGRFLPCLR